MSNKTEILNTLDQLSKNNNREWFQDNKSKFDIVKADADRLFQTIYEKMNDYDHLEALKIYRIYRDVRFSLDKTPYKNHFGASFGRLKPNYRGGYYIQIEPNNTFIAMGFWGPNKEDLLRIRQEIAIDNEIETVLNNKRLKETFGSLEGEELKTAPKGFDKNHDRVAFLRKKQFILIKKFSNEEFLANDFEDKVVNAFKNGLPFVEYFTSILTTNANGEWE